MLRLLGFLSFSLLLSCGDGVEDVSKLVSLTGKALGTTWTVKVRSLKPVEKSKLRADISAKLEET